MENGMKVKSVFFYQAVKIGSKMINSAHEDHFDITYQDNLCFLYDRGQDLRVAIPSTNIPQLQLYAEPQAKQLSPIEKARLAKAAKAAE
jgi:hypothetical protein